jgi:predicted RND superfamily exporter protein
MSLLSSLRDRFERFVFEHRGTILVAFGALTLVMAGAASRLHIDAGFSKMLPLQHEYMQTFTQHRQEFGGANRVLIALMAKDGDIFTPSFFDALREATDEVFFIPGVDRAQVRSLFTPNVRFTEVVEEGIAGGNVVPDDFEPTPEGFETVRQNILKAGIVGRLVANDFSGALISAQLLEFDPATGAPLDYVFVADELERRIRERHVGNGIDVIVDTHIIGFAKVIGDITNGAGQVVLFFGLSVLVTTLCVLIYTQSFRLTFIPIGCSLVAVVWQLGILTLLGYGIDPMAILVPFLIFAIGVSHGVQMVSGIRSQVYLGADAMTAVRKGLHGLIIPGAIALLSDAVGFLTIYYIKIQVIREMAITASLGVAVVILTNLVFVPILLSYMTYTDAFRGRLFARARHLEPVWRNLAKVARRPLAALVLAAAALLAGLGAWKAKDVRIGDLHAGVPELRRDSRYNVDSRVVSEKFSIGVDLLSVIVETVPQGCIEYDVMSRIDDFAWHMRNVEGVHSVFDLPGVGKIINAGWNEGSLKWRELPRNPSTLVQAVSYVTTESGLLNNDCSVMPVMLFTTDHKARTIERIVEETKRYREAHGSERVRFRLATGNVGVMAATNEEVEADQFPILIGVFGVVIFLCWVTFRSLRGVLCVILPLALVSILAYALMAWLEIGLKVSTLPVVALGVGIGVDYGIYIYARFRSILAEGGSIEEAYRTTLAITGTGVFFTGVTLAIGTGAWIFSPLKFQADMGILLTFMFIVNMLGAIILLPALAAWLFKD